MLNNFKWQREDEPQNMLSYVFLFVSAFVGTGFAFFSKMESIQISPFAAGGLDPALWGVLCLVLVVLTLFSIAVRNKLVGQQMGLFGILVWGYGFILYALANMWFAAIAVFLPQILFWVFWGIDVSRYYEREKKK